LAEGEIERRLEMGGLVVDGEIKPVAKVLASIQGLTLGVTVRDKIFGSLKIDFGVDAGPLTEKGKAMVIGALQRWQLMMDDVNNWTFEVNGPQIKMSGPLTNAGFRKVLSLVRQSIEHDLVSGQGQGAEPTSEQAMATASKLYFNKVEMLFDELRNKPDNTSLVTYAKWFEKYADEIDHMSMLNVDEQVAKFGLYVSQSFRDTAAVLRGANLDKRAQLAGTADEFSGGRFGAYGGYGYGYTSGSYFYMNDRSRERRAIGTQIDVQGEKQARDILGEVVKTMTETRGQMSQKYQIDF
jgi:hypothetical protein